MNEIVLSIIAFAIGGTAYVVLIVILKHKRKMRETAEIIEEMWAKMNKQDKGGKEMDGWKFTKVWQVDHKLVVADTVKEAVELYKTYMGEDYRNEPVEIRCIGADTALCDRNALIKED